MEFVDLGLRIQSHSTHGIDGNLSLRSISSLRDPFQKSSGLMINAQKVLFCALFIVAFEHFLCTNQSN